jgi:Secretion system C-terminal sorting domain
MKYKILPVALLLFAAATAQKQGKIFAITSDSQQRLWMNLNEVDVSNGKIIRPLFERSKTSFLLYDGTSKTKIQAPVTTTGNTGLMAAAAFDARHNKLFIAPMHLPAIRWVDMDDNNTTLKVYTQPLPGFTDQHMQNDANHITRMTMAPDGNGYALTNDGNHLFQFTTGKKTTITDFGALQDAGAQTQISIHNRCSSWGGDMIAAASGDLYIITAYQSVFKVTVIDRKAYYLANITGLPANYTTNGAAINTQGELIVCSANSTEGYYKIDMQNWKAQKHSNGASASDLASSYFAFQQPNQIPVQQPITKETLQRIVVYPNPVTEGILRVSFDNRETGNYQVQLTDLGGRQLLNKQINVTNNKQLIEIAVPATLAKGLYLIKIITAAGKNAYTDKIMIQ